MQNLIIYDSLYGNTRKIAEKIAGVMPQSKALKVDELKPEILQNIKFLIVGSPTQGGRPTILLQRFLNQIPANTLKNIKVAAFDTRLSEKDVNFALRLLIKTIGYAAPKIAKSLEKKGGKLAAPPRGFIVRGKEGPLADGELERIDKWIKSLL